MYITLYAAANKQVVLDTIKDTETRHVAQPTAL